MQEVILAKNIQVLCGNKSLDYSSLDTFAIALTEVYPAILVQTGDLGEGTKLSGLINTREIRTLRAVLPNSDLTRFCDLLQVARYGEVTNKLDRIYGLLGVFATELRDSIVVDYKMGLCEGYIQFCKAFVAREPTLAIFSMAPSMHSLAGLPSWCPNFDSVCSHAPLLSYLLGHKAGFEDGLPRRSLVAVDDLSNEIEIPGFQVDIVRNIVQSSLRVSRDQAKIGGPTGDAANNLSWESECLALFHEVSPPTSSDPQESYCRALIGEHWLKTQPVPLSTVLRPDYLNLIKFWTDLRDFVAPVINGYEAKESLTRYLNPMYVNRSRNFFNTRGGRVGLGPSGIRTGDIVCVFYSGGPLFVLRPVLGSTTTYQLVGDAYVQGLMDLKSIPEDARGQDETFILV